MSYLDGPRLVFTGRVLTDVPTVNNSTEAYGDTASADPMWNPMGGGAFDLLDCRVVGDERDPGTLIGPDGAEPVLAVVGAADRPTAKLVDLDPEWQGSSEIWGLTVRVVVAATGEELLSGSFRPAPFRDLWPRQVGAVALNGMPMGGSFTSVLDDVRFGPGCDGRPAVAALREATLDHRLSIVLNLFGVYYNHVDDLFGTGRLTGVLGPWRPGEPELLHRTAPRQRNFAQPDSRRPCRRSGPPGVGPGGRRPGQRVPDRRPRRHPGSAAGTRGGSGGGRLRR